MTEKNAEARSLICSAVQIWLRIDSKLGCSKPIRDSDVIFSFIWSSRVLDFLLAASCFPQDNFKSLTEVIPEEFLIQNYRYE